MIIIVIIKSKSTLCCYVDGDTNWGIPIYH